MLRANLYGEGRGGEGGHHYMAYILGAREKFKILNLFVCIEKGTHSLRGSINLWVNLCCCSDCKLT